MRRLAKYKTRYRIPGITKRKDPVYKSWYGMMRRCYQNKNKDYRHYGGRGIKVCRSWRSFNLFYLDMAPSHKIGLTLDRIDNNKGYSKSNCRWATMKQQADNRRRTRLITNPHTGETLPLIDWARKLKISRLTITSRIRLGYSDFDSLMAKKHGIRNGKLKTDHFEEEAREVLD